MALNRARSHSNDVTVIARILSDLMDLLIIALTIVCVIEARGQTQFLIFKTFGMSSKLRVCSNYLIFWGMGAVFETNQHIRRFQNSLERS